MEQVPGKLVVKAYAPARPWIAGVTVLLLVAVAVYGAFELGRYQAGYDALRATAQRGALQQQLAQLQQAQHQLNVQLASAQEQQVADIRERAEVARTIGQLQAQVERQQQDVEFYRGLVAPQAAQAANVTVRVQQFHIAALPVAQQFVLHFTLNRLAQPERNINGTLAITVDGSQNGGPGSADLATLTGGKNELAFDFRYYADIEQQITLPVAFKPDSVTIEVRPARKGVAPYRQTFIWEVDPI
ncbi:MAG TPA: DUF6776 family protein [Steroidobacteraceae bacterium]|jgi:uncharacterized protein YpmS|nr:DUF6776 family protein [Steroidobacteraceae bacterium]